MDCTKEVIVRGLTDAIRNCNRNIYEWMKNNKRGLIFSISHTEIRGLVKNWIIRCLKDTLGTVRADKVLREGNLYVSIDDKNNCINYISLSSTDVWRNIAKDIDFIKECMKEVKYNTLKYDPNDYINQDAILPPDWHFGHPANVDLSSIEKIKF